MLFEVEKLISFRKVDKDQFAKLPPETGANERVNIIRRRLAEVLSSKNLSFFNGSGCSPYMQDGIRGGTVDRFQGQDAPICLVSMTASTAEEMSRGMEFLFSLNRINMAVSRAKGVASEISRKTQ
jgi:hypothetical protein